MSDSDVEVPVDASTATDRESWLDLIDQIGEEEGYFQTLGPRHWAMFVDDGPRLLVTFETIATARARPGQMPLGHAIASEMGWSHLCLIADEAPWFRDRAVWGYVDRLVDEGFFEDFDAVCFYGAGPLGYAACAYCVAAPGARVLALAPPATLDPGLAGWDSRDRAARRLDFTSRYGFAPDMTEGAAQVTLLCDPFQRLDQMHAALYHGAQTQVLPTRHAGGDLEAVLARLGLLDGLIIAAAEGRLTPLLFAQLWRKRRDDPIWLRSFHQAVEAQGSQARLRALYENITRRLNLPRYSKKLAAMNARIDMLAKPEVALAGPAKAD